MKTYKKIFFSQNQDQKKLLINLSNQERHGLSLFQFGLIMATNMKEFPKIIIILVSNSILIDVNLKNISKRREVYLN